MSRKVGIGILGGGGILNAYVPGFKEVGDSATVTAVAEPSKDQ